VTRVLDTATGKELLALSRTEKWFPGRSVAFSPDGKTLAVANAGENAHVKLWDVATGEERFTLKGPTCDDHSLAFSPDGKVLAVAGEDDRKGKTTAIVVRLWDPAKGKQITDLSMQGDRTHYTPSLGFSRNGILVTASDAAVRIWEMEKK
jgi:WD40 repeat protein